MDAGKDELQRKLFYSTQHNRGLEEELQEAPKLIHQNDELIDSPHHGVSLLEIQLHEAVRSRADIKKLLHEVKEELKRLFIFRGSGQLKRTPTWDPRDEQNQQENSKMDWQET